MFTYPSTFTSLKESEVAFYVHDNISHYEKIYSFVFPFSSNFNRAQYSYIFAPFTDYMVHFMAEIGNMHSFIERGG